MKLYLSSVLHDYCNGVIDNIDTFILESFYSIEPRFKDLYHKCKGFLLDSGAFYYQNNERSTDFNNYCDRYIDFINEKKIENFFELDVDSSEKYRERIERRTGKRPIPVWHVKDGVDYFKGLCRDYDYVALSTTEVSKKDYPDFRYILDYAHSVRTRVHGLGFTSLKYLPVLHFDSVDSSSWSSGRRFHLYWEFDYRTGTMKSTKKSGRVKDWRKLTKHNYREWQNFSRFAYSTY